MLALPAMSVARLTPMRSSEFSRSRRIRSRADHLAAADAQNTLNVLTAALSDDFGLLELCFRVDDASMKMVEPTTVARALVRPTRDNCC